MLNSQGFSLIQMTVAISIVGILSAAILRSTSFFAGTLAANSQTAELRALAIDLGIYLRDDTICTNTLSGQDFSGNEITFTSLPIRSTSSTTILPLATGVQSSGINITSIKLVKNPTTAIGSKMIASVNHDKYVAHLAITSQKSNTALGTKGNRPINIPIFIYVNRNTNLIHSCASMNSTLAICEQMLSGTMVGNKCRLTTYTKRYRNSGIRFSTSQGPGSFQGGDTADLLGNTTYESGHSEWQVQAPRCPPNTTIIACNTTMVTQTGRNEEYYNRDYDWDHGGTIADTNVNPKMWWVTSYLDKTNLDGESRPNCVMRVYRGVIEGTYTDYYPTSVCVAHDPALLP